MGSYATALIMVGQSVIKSRAESLQGDIQKQEAEYNAQVQANKSLAIDYASRAEQDRINRANRRDQATQRAVASKSGVIISEDTPLEVLMEQVGEMALEANNQRRTRLIQKQDSLGREEAYLHRGNRSKKLAEYKSRATLLNGILSGIGSIASNFEPTDPLSEYDPTDTGLIGTSTEINSTPKFDPIYPPKG